MNDISKTLSIVIVTYQREQVLLDSIIALLKLSSSCSGFVELFVVDQTEEHSPNVDSQLKAWHANREIIWLQLDEPNLVHAMNVGLKEVTSDIVLFLDDDIIPHENLLSSHLIGHHTHPEVSAVVGQVLQPGQDSQQITYEPNGSKLRRYLDFPFYSNKGRYIENMMAGNLSLKCAKVLSLGGFDEQFSPPVASRFETEYAKRMIEDGQSIWFEPSASIRHLQASEGGTRSQGHHLTSASPIFAVGDYYYALKHGEGWDGFSYIFGRFFRQIRTRYHLSHPWMIPVKWLGELRALRLALSQYTSSNNVTSTNDRLGE